MKIVYSELFGPTYQGEGFHQGVPSIFLRLFGCNFRCPQFSLPEGSPYRNIEVQEVIDNIAKYNTFDELPLVHTGCDSYTAIYPEFKKFNKSDDSLAVAANVNNMAKDGKCDHLVITGGEPLLPGQQKKLVEFLTHLSNNTIKHITFETNGTQIISDELFNSIKPLYNITVSASVKLESSGESRQDRVQYEIISDLHDKSDIMYLKFVVTRMSDFDEIDEIVANCNYDFIYVMPAGGTTTHYDQNKSWVADEALRRGYRYSPRLQIDLWGNQWGT